MGNPEGAIRSPAWSGPEGALTRCGTSVGEALEQASSILAKHGSTTPRLDAEVLLAAVLGQSRAQLYAHWKQPLSSEEAGAYARLVQRRSGHEPVAYLLGQRAFYDVDLVVDCRVLIPRPETEHLVDEALSWARLQRRPLRILDMGTGSGACAVVLARHLATSHVWAVDVSRDALAVAQRNVARYGLQHRVSLVCGDLVQALRGPFDLVLANLPYISRPGWDDLAPDIALYEPRLALDGGEDGLDLIRRLVQQMCSRLARPGLLLLEIDHRQAVAVGELVLRTWADAHLRIVDDYAGLARVVRVELAAPGPRGNEVVDGL